MQRIIERFDGVAGIHEGKGWSTKLDRAIFVLLVLMVVSAPHSIAATQTAWLLGMAVWIIRSTLAPRPKFSIGPVDLALWGFFAWSALSSALSYEPAVSLDHLKGVSLFLIFYFVVKNVRRRQGVYFLVLAMLVSCMVNVVWVPIERSIGRGVEISDIQPDSLFSKTVLADGDTLLEANGTKLRTPDDLVKIVERDGRARVKFYRPDYYAEVEVNSVDLGEGATANERLGIGGWRKSHNWRSQGFYGHYTTYAEVLQLLLAMAFGLIVALHGNDRAERQRYLGAKIFLIVAFAGMCFALLLTVTRASQLAFMIGAFCILLIGGSRRLAVAAIIIAIPIVFAALLFLQQSRNTGFFDAKDESTRYRTVMMRDGLRIWSSNAHHVLFGVGMDSIKEHWQEWGMFEGGNLPMGHFHSTPVQILVERGLPALLLWIAILASFGRILWNGIKREKASRTHGGGDPWAFGILLGALGGAIGFVTSGIVHYNLGDQEVAMVFYLMMGFGAAVTRLPEDRSIETADV